MATTSEGAIKHLTKSSGNHLLDLPGELRNRIYRYIILEDDVIEVTSDGPGEPALLRTCKEVRQESIGLFYCENEFDLQIKHWNGLALLPFMKQYAKYGHSHQAHPCRLHFVFTGDTNWDNMMAWVKSAVFGHGFYPLLHHEDNDAEDHTIIAVHKLVQAVRGLPWESVEKALAAFYDALRTTDSKWVKEEDRLIF